MKKLREIYRTMDRKTKMLVTGVGIFFIVLIIAVILIGIFKNKNLTYAGLENKIKLSAMKYYKENKELLPKEDGNEVTIDSVFLNEEGYLKSLTKYRKDADTCQATVKVVNNNGYYNYTTYLVCEEYETISLYNKIIEIEPVVEEKNGLYKINDEYIYRGEYVNNYVTFAERPWRILSLKADGTVRLLQADVFEDDNWDNRYNLDSQYNSGITNFEISRIKDKLATIYTDEEIFPKEAKSLITTQNLCIASVSLIDTTRDGSIECAEQTVDKYPIGLIQLNELYYASIDQNCDAFKDPNCTNYNYLAKYKKFWTITPAKENSYTMYCINKGKSVIQEASSYAGIRVTLNLTKNVVYKSGTGTLEDPYIVD